VLIFFFFSAEKHLFRTHFHILFQMRNPIGPRVLEFKMRKRPRKGRPTPALQNLVRRANWAGKCGESNLGWWAATKKLENPAKRSVFIFIFESFQTELVGEMWTGGMFGWREGVYSEHRLSVAFSPSLLSTPRVR
jgi:hypothetical protein